MKYLACSTYFKSMSGLSHRSPPTSSVLLKFLGPRNWQGGSHMWVLGTAVEHKLQGSGYLLEISILPFSKLKPRSSFSGCIGRIS